MIYSIIKKNYNYIIVKQYFLQYFGQNYNYIVIKQYFLQYLDNFPLIFFCENEWNERCIYID